MKHNTIFIILILLSLFFDISCNREKSIKSFSNNLKKIEKHNFFSDTIINISTNNFYIELKSFAVIDSDNNKHLYKQIIYFYNNKNLLDSTNFKILPSKTTINKKLNISILTCSIYEISLICGKDDTLYRLYGGGKSKQLEYFAIYSLDGNLLTASLSNWDTVYMRMNNLEKIKEKFKLNDSLIFYKYCKTADIYNFTN